MTHTATPPTTAATQAATAHPAESTTTSGAAAASPTPRPQGTSASDPNGPRPGAVTFRMFASARAAAGTAEVHIAPGPTAQVVAALTAGLPPRFADVLESCTLLADGVRLDHHSPAPIPAGTTVDVLPPFAGG